MRDEYSLAESAAPEPASAMWLLSSTRSAPLHRIGQGRSRRGVKAMLYLGDSVRRSAARRTLGGAAPVSILPATAPTPLARLRGALLEAYLRRRALDTSDDLLLSTQGIELIYRALAQRWDSPKGERRATDIIADAQSSRCLLCVETIEHYCDLVGAAAADTALGARAVGGVYLAGPLTATLFSFFKHGSFRKVFEERHGDLSDIGAIPTYAVGVHELPLAMGARRVAGVSQQSILLP